MSPEKPPGGSPIHKCILGVILQKYLWGLQCKFILQKVICLWNTHSSSSVHKKYLGGPRYIKDLQEVFGLYKPLYGLLSIKRILWSSSFVLKSIEGRLSLEDTQQFLYLPLSLVYIQNVFCLQMTSGCFRSLEELRHVFCLQKTFGSIFVNGRPLGCQLKKTSL